MRLTLRTLLAYLDDTLPSNEIKTIGQKVAESEPARELIERIKKVTRRRRLTTPPATGPEARFDANDIAEYLDNELSGDRLAELEKTCLESDVHLAEVASCHQILTLVLGEPALVPPTAKERMYGLVHGHEAISRKPPPVTKTIDSAPPEDADLLGLPLRGSWLRWLLPVAGVLLLGAIGLALWQVRDPGRSSRRTASDKKADLARTGDSDKDKDKGGKPESDKGGGAADKGAAEKDKGAGDKSGKVGAGGGTKPPEDKDKGKTPPETGTGREQDGAVERPEEPSKRRVVTGTYTGGPARRDPSVLVRQAADGWERIAPGSGVYTTEPLVSLPGFLSQVRTRSGVGLLLRGEVPQFAIPNIPVMYYLLESAVVLHEDPKYDLDLTLQRGRVYLSNNKRKGPATVRLRFLNEIWDVKLREPGDELGIDLVTHYTRDIDWRRGEEPYAELYLWLTRGEAEVTVNSYFTRALQAPPGKALMGWNNHHGTPQVVEVQKVPPAWDKEPPDKQVAPEAPRMSRALRELEGRLAPKKQVEVAVRESLQKEGASPESRVLAIYCMGATDDVGKLIDILGDEDVTHAPDRDAAIFVLRRWTDRDKAQGPKLYDDRVNEKTKERTVTGILIDKRYRPSNARIIYDLLHDLPDELRTDPKTYSILANYLRNQRVAIAELGWWHLRRLAASAEGVKLPPFNAAAPAEEREKVADEVDKLVKKGRLPPRPPEGSAPGGAPGEKPGKKPDERPERR